MINDEELEYYQKCPKRIGDIKQECISCEYRFICWEVIKVFDLIDATKICQNCKKWEIFNLEGQHDFWENYNHCKLARDISGWKDGEEFSNLDAPIIVHDDDGANAECYTRFDFGCKYWESKE